MAKSNEEYLADSNSCPFCGSSDVEGDSFDVDAGGVWQPIVCTTCNRKWNDLYTLTGYEEVT